MPASDDSETFAAEALIAGPTPLHDRKVTLLAGENRARGAVLGKIIASGKYVLSASAAVDGSEVPDLILAEDCDATAADTVCLTYSTGDFAESEIVLGAGHTADSVREGLRDKGIHLIKTQGA